jgi:hypothetical protein
MLLSGGIDYRIPQIRGKVNEFPEIRRIFLAGAYTGSDRARGYIDRKEEMA